MIGRRPASHWHLLFALALMWGSSFTLTKVAVASFTPSAVVTWRLVIAAVVLSCLVAVLRKRPPASRRLWLFIGAMAVTGNALPFWLITWGQQRIDSGLAGILMAIMPLSTLVLAHFLVAGERLTGLRAGGFLIGFAGIVVLVGPDALFELTGRGGALLSQLAVLGGALCYAVNTIIARRRPASDALVAAAGVMVVASVMMLPTFALSGPSVIAGPAPAAIAAVAVSGLVSTALATVVHLKLIKLAGPSFVSLINYLIPLWAVAFGMIFLGERPEWSALAALALILAGMAVSEVFGRRAPR